MAKLRRTTERDSGREHVWFFCPGCEQLHRFRIKGGPRQWTFDGDIDRPTFAPSLLYPGHCHLFLRAGVLEFLSDSAHALAGKSVPLPELPEWFADATAGCL